ncbi:restriction endonuclease subunit S [Oryzomonas rubra]|uniref:Type I restriction modification DNA specificity domain-containing protein n=1 Tax=Oryzomonas rubra TaxID=2509454 RepID=A0A5A9XAA4_9BACT|nr:restriction endonuclease subunit S [Oryzomonas rubra]KAA0889840.1 hypothetical protein ET418_13795 [Oryzomonas rubra]
MMDSLLNRLPSTWPLVPIGAICQVGAGNGAPQGDSYFVGGTYPFVRMQDVGRCQTPYITTTTDRLNDLAIEKHSLRQWPAGSLLIPKSGASVALNKRALLREPAYVVSHLAVLIPGDLIDPEYLYHLTCTLDMMRLALDPAYPSLRTSDLARLRIPLPTLSEQRWIVNILQEVEEIRRLRAEAEARIVKLIPAMFEEEFGDPVQNPRKWDIKSLAAVINGTPKNGLYKPADLYGDGTPIIRIGDFTGGNLRTSKNLQRVRITDEEVEQFSVGSGQILINRVNSIEHLGKSLLVASLTEPTVYESNMMRLDPKTEKVLPDFLIACLQHSSIVAKLRAKAKKAINQASINQTDVLTLQIPVPPLSVQEGFALQVAQAEGLRTSGERSMRTERALNAALSAHAFSGQLTADWREANKDKLADEARERDGSLKKAGAVFSHTRLTMAEEIEELLHDRTDGIYAALNREQRGLLGEIERMFGGVDYGRYFTAEQLATDIKGALHRHSQRIESHLSLFAARGLIIPVSRPRSDSTGPAFAACYRLPITEKLASNDEKDTTDFDSDDIRSMLMETQRKLATGGI